MKFDNRLLQSLTKVLLHEHLDGVLRLRRQAVIERARDTKYRNLPVDDPQGLAKWFSRGANQGSLAKYPIWFRSGRLPASTFIANGNRSRFGWPRISAYKRLKENQSMIRSALPTRIAEFKRGVGQA